MYFGLAAKPLRPDVDARHKILTDKIRKSENAVDESAIISRGVNSRMGAFNIRRPTSKERDIMLGALKGPGPTLKEDDILKGTVVKTLPDSPEHIVDTIFIYDDNSNFFLRMLFGETRGYYSYRDDSIFLSSRVLSESRASLLHTILHEYTHYQHAMGHRVDSRKNKVEYDDVYEETRADTHAVRLLNCARCAEELKDKRGDLLDAAIDARTGYVGGLLYRDRNELAKMRHFCSNCLQARKDKIANNFSGINALEEKIDTDDKKRAAQEEANLLGDEMLDYPVSSDAGSDLDDVRL